MIAVGFYVVSGALAEIFAPQLMGLFTDDAELLRIGVPGMRVGYLGIPFMGITIITNSALQGLGPLRRHRRQHNSRLLPNLDNPLAQKPAGARGEIATSGLYI